eukprot:scaffold8250_cov239-Pinguiococcus_pyrenoidosus.AAC.3
MRGRKAKFRPPNYARELSPTQRNEVSPSRAQGVERPRTGHSADAAGAGDGSKNPNPRGSRGRLQGKSRTRAGVQPPGARATSLPARERSVCHSKLQRDVLEWLRDLGMNPSFLYRKRRRSRSPGWPGHDEPWDIRNSGESGHRDRPYYTYGPWNGIALSQLAVIVERRTSAGSRRAHHKQLWKDGSDGCCSSPFVLV